MTLDNATVNIGNNNSDVLTIVSGGQGAAAQFTLGAGLTVLGFFAPTLVHL